MDNDVRDAFLTLNAVLAIMARRQTEQGEMLAGIVKLLTPDKGEKQGSSLQESVERMTAAIQSAAAMQAAALRDLSDIVRSLPSGSVRASDDSIGQLTKAGP